MDEGWGSPPPGAPRIHQRLVSHPRAQPPCFSKMIRQGQKNDWKENGDRLIWFYQIKENISLQIRIVAENGLKVMSPLLDLLLLASFVIPHSSVTTSDPLCRTPALTIRVSGAGLTGLGSLFGSDPGRVLRLTECRRLGNISVCTYSVQEQKKSTSLKQPWDLIGNVCRNGTPNGNTWERWRQFGNNVLRSKC